MTHLLIPSDVEYEILVVDNNSTDATEQVSMAFATRLPIRRIFESRQLRAWKARVAHDSSGESR